MEQFVIDVDFQGKSCRISERNYVEWKRGQERIRELLLQGLSYDEVMNRLLDEWEAAYDE